MSNPNRVKEKVKNKLRPSSSLNNESHSSSESQPVSGASSVRLSTSSRLSDERPASSRGPSFDTRPSSESALPQHQRDLLLALSKQKYVLRTTCGPSYDPSTHVPLPVNSPQAVTISNDFMTAHLKLRIRNFRGLPLASQEHTPYFDDPVHARDQYSVAFSFVPKADIPSASCRWGNDFDHPVRDRLPPGFNTAFRIVKEFIDPGLSCDAYSDKPWVFGPATSCWFVMRVGDKVGEGGEFPVPQESPAMTEGGSGDGIDVRRDAGMPEESEKRRKWMLKEENRQRFVFEKGRWYQGDFYNPYLDFSNFALKLPGFSLNVIKYINDKTHQLRYVFKNIETGDVYFVVVLTLLFGQELKDELADAEQGPARGEAEQNGVLDDQDSDGDCFEDAPEVLVHSPTG